MYKKILTIALAGLLAFSVPVAAAPSSWAQAEVTAAQNAGIVPERLQSEYQNPVTREEFCEMAMLLWCKLTEKEMPVVESTFADTQNASVAAAQSLGIVRGESETQFSPNNLVTRQEMCVMLQNALAAAKPEVTFPAEYANTFPDEATVADWAVSAVKSMNLFAVMLGDENGNINPLANTTREQAILLAYRLMKTQTHTLTELVEQFFMPVSGNTHDNMLGGAFVVGMSGGTVYYSGQTGIRKMDSETPVMEKPAKNMVAFEKAIYYIGEDGAIYLMQIASGEERKLVDTVTDSFSAFNNCIYYRNLNDGGRIYEMSLSTYESVAITPGSAELPVIANEGTFYTDGTAIYKMEKDKTTTKLYEGKNAYLCLNGEMFYFLNEEGLICSLPLEGGTPAVVSGIAVKSFCFTRDCLVAIGREDSAVYKVDYSGRYNIKMDTGTYVNINTYDDYVYALDAEGGIYRFSNNATEKARIN
ncbi:MAG: DUF5050 domain-containing protein [Clostridia bacterium]|nr:DUF5050 domain-containing protein [Oscillospiraceae bacterium]MBQ7033324.1 DUF5050 domain-containing protein [Clostridia bacterium]